MTPMLITSATRVKLARVEDDLRHEFPHISEERIGRLMHAVTDDLVEHARFDDFVPLLAHRSAREHLAGQPERAESRAA